MSLRLHLVCLFSSFSKFKVSKILLGLILVVRLHFECWPGQSPNTLLSVDIDCGKKKWKNVLFLTILNVCVDIIDIFATVRGRNMYKRCRMVLRCKYYASSEN